MLGDINALDRRKPGQSALELASRLGELFEIKLLGRRIYFLSSAALAAEVHDDAAWEKAVGPSFRRLRQLAGNGLILADNKDPAWASAHRILVDGFTRDAMRSYHPKMVVAIGELVTKWSALAGGPVDVTPDMNRLTLEIVARAGFGYTFSSFERDGDFVPAMIRVMEYANRPVGIDVIDRTVGRNRRQLNEADVAYLQNVADELINTYTPGESTLLDRMLTTPDPVTGMPLPRDEIRNQVLTFLIAGHETSAGTVTFALHQLAQNPIIAKRIRVETATILRGRSVTEIEHADVARLRYLRRVIDETMRLHPVAPGYFRKAKRPTTLGAGRYVFGRGDWVYVNLLQLHRDPAVWGPTATVFDPDRFSSDQVRARTSHAFKPFGVGSRACIGRQFALHEILLAVATINYMFDLAPASPDPELEIHELVTLKPTLRLVLRPLCALRT